MVCDPGHEYFTFQPVIALDPLLVTVNPSWNPPDHELVSVQVAVQPLPAVVVGLAEAEALGLVEAEADADGDGLAECDAEADAEGEALADGEPVGVVPAPPDRTTTDSAGTEIEVPLAVPLTTVGFAASYVYSVSELLVRPRLEVETV